MDMELGEDRNSMGSFSMRYFFGSAGIRCAFTGAGGLVVACAVLAASSYGSLLGFCRSVLGRERTDSKAL